MNTETSFIKMTTHHPSELELSTTADSVTSSPRSDLPPHDLQSRVRFMCSFGGKILPRPHDNQLRYVGGDTRIVAVNHHTSFSALLSKLSKVTGTTNISVKYQLPSEDLDALISVTTDEDVENMMDEYDRLVHTLGSKTNRLRLFLFPSGDDSRNSSISSLLDGSVRRESWFFDALNGGSVSGGAAGLERGRSEASSIVSEVPDYLFGLDNSDETQPREPKFKTRASFMDNVSASDPGSPAPALSSPYCSTSSAAPYLQAIPDLPPVKTKPDSPAHVVTLKESNAERGEPQMTQNTGYAGNNNMWNYLPMAHYPSPSVNQMPVYYVPGPIPPSNLSGQQSPVQPQYVQQFTAPPGQIPVGLHHPGPGAGQIYGGGAMRPVAALDPYNHVAARMVPDGLNQQVYYGVKSGGMVPTYPGMVMQGGEEMTGIGSGSDGKSGRV